MKALHDMINGQNMNHVVTGTTDYWKSGRRVRYGRCRVCGKFSKKLVKHYTKRNKHNGEDEMKTDIFVRCEYLHHGETTLRKELPGQITIR